MFKEVAVAEAVAYSRFYLGTCLNEQNKTMKYDRKDIGYHGQDWNRTAPKGPRHYRSPTPA
jgi:hypothetical protein